MLKISKNQMEFTLEELEIIKDGLILALTHLPDMLEDQKMTIDILDRIDNETNLD